MSQQHPNEAIKAKLCIYFQEIAHIMFKPQEPNNPHFIQIIALLQIMVKSGGCVCVCVCVRVCVCVCVSTPSCHVALVLYFDILSCDD